MSGISPTDGLPLWCRRVVVARRLDDTLRAGGSTMCIWMEYGIYDCVHIGYAWIRQGMVKVNTTTHMPMMCMDVQSWQSAWHAHGTDIRASTLTPILLQLNGYRFLYIRLQPPLHTITGTVYNFTCIRLQGWSWHNCHQHWHYDNYAHYALRALCNDSTVAWEDRPVVGHKNGWCAINIPKIWCAMQCTLSHALLRRIGV